MSARPNLSLPAPLPRLGLMGGLLALTVLGACTNKRAEEEAKKKAEAEAKPACDLTPETLPEKAFIREIDGANGKEDDLLARARFFKDGDTLKVKYNARALTDMYTFSCAPEKDGLICLEDAPRLGDFCRSLIANGKECTAAEVAAVTGASVEEAQKEVDKVLEEVKKLPEKELADMKLMFNQPNNQLRGVIHVKIKTEKCRINISDRYQTMTFGQVREMENIVGTSAFNRTDKELVFEHCKESKSLVALSAPGAAAKPGESVIDWGVGAAVPFRYVGEITAKAEAGCTYTQDTFVQYEPVQKGAPVADEGGKLAWGFDHAFSKAGKYVVTVYRDKSCGGAAPERVDVLCQAVRIK
jgi:hypothetical protein